MLGCLVPPTVGVAGARKAETRWRVVGDRVPARFPARGTVAPATGDRHSGSVCNDGRLASLFPLARTRYGQTSWLSRKSAQKACSMFVAIGLALSKVET